MGLNAPHVVGSDPDRGFLLLTDLGSVPYLKKVESDPDSVPQLYIDAIDTLSELQAKGTRYQRQLPTYDEELLRFELSIFREWLCDAHLGVTFSASDEQSWESSCDVLVHNALAFATGAAAGFILSRLSATRRALTFEIGIQNSGLALVILLSQLEGLGGAAAIAALWGVWHLIAGGLIATMFRFVDRITKPDYDVERA